MPHEGGSDEVHAAANDIPHAHQLDAKGSTDEYLLEGEGQLISTTQQETTEGREFDCAAIYQ